MAFQSGEEPIEISSTTASVEFSPGFMTTPAVIIAVVQNQVDSPQLQLNAQVTDKDANGFTVSLDAPTDSANYELVWIAGDASLVFESVTKLGTRITDLPSSPRELRANDRLVVVQDGVTRQVPFSEFQSAFVSRNPAIPTASTSNGAVGQLAFGPGNLFAHTGTKWLRLAPAGHPTDWTIPASDSTKPAQGGRATLANNDEEKSISYDEPFPSDGGIPQVFFTLRNITDPAPTAIYGNVTASSLTGFTVTFSGEIDSNNWVLDWFAVQY